MAITKMKQIIKCTICRSDKNITVMNKEIFLFHCRNCNHTFTKPSKRLEKYRENYFSEVHKNWFEHPNYKLFEFIRGRISENTSVLDVGCGNGDLLKYLLSRGVKGRLTGIDLALNRKTPGIEFIKGDFYTHKLAGRFDVICTLGTIEHIEKPILFVEKIRSLLNNKGLLIIMTVDSDSLLYWAARFVNWLGMGLAYKQLFYGHHLQHFTKDSLNKLLEMNGYRVIYQKNHNFPLKSVDVPKGNTLMKSFYLILVAFLFLASSLISRGMLQTVVCRKKI